MYCIKLLFKEKTLTNLHRTPGLKHTLDEILIQLIMPIPTHTHREYKRSFSHAKFVYNSTLSFLTLSIKKMGSLILDVTYFTY